MILALLKTTWNFFHGGKEGNMTLEGNSLNVTSPMKLSTIPCPPMEGSQEILVTIAPPRSPLPPAASGDTEDTPPMT